MFLQGFKLSAEWGVVDKGSSFRFSFMAQKRTNFYWPPNVGSLILSSPGYGISVIIEAGENFLLSLTKQANVFNKKFQFVKFGFVP